MFVATSSVKSAFDHFYAIAIGKTKRDIRAGKVRVGKGITTAQLKAGVNDPTIQRYVAEGRAHYTYHYTKNTTGVILVSQDW